MHIILVSQYLHFHSTAFSVSSTSTVSDSLMLFSRVMVEVILRKYNLVVREQAVSNKVQIIILSVNSFSEVTDISFKRFGCHIHVPDFLEPSTDVVLDLIQLSTHQLSLPHLRVQTVQPL